MISCKSKNVRINNNIIILNEGEQDMLVVEKDTSYEVEIKNNLILHRPQNGFWNKVKFLMHLYRFI
jgi:hypothetical protein